MAINCSANLLKNLMEKILKLNKNIQLGEAFNIELSKQSIEWSTEAKILFIFLIIILLCSRKF